MKFINRFVFVSFKKNITAFTNTFLKILNILLLITLSYSIHFSQPANKSDSLLNILNNSEDKIKKAEVLKELAIHYDGISNYERSLFYAKELNKISEFDDDMTLYYINSLDLIENVLFIYGNYSEAIQTNQKIFEFSQPIDNLYGTAIAKVNLSRIYVRLGDEVTALLYANEALENFIELNDKENILETKVHTLNILLYSRNYKEYYNLCNEILEENNNREPKITAYVNNSIGIIKFYEGDYESAKKYYNIGLKIYTEIGDLNRIGVIYGNLAEIYEIEGNIVKAEEFYLKAKKIAEETGYKSGLPFLYLGLAKIYLNKGNHEKAENFSLKALSIAVELTEKQTQLKALEFLAEVYKDLNKYKLAYKYLEKYKGLKDTLYKENKVAESEKLKVRFDITKKDYDAKLLKQNFDYLENVNKIKSVIILLGLGILIISAFFLLTIYRNRNLLKKQKQEQIVLNDELKSTNEELKQTLGQLKEAQSSLLQSEKMASLGILTAGVAHEINNPLNFISVAHDGLKDIHDNLKKDETQRTFKFLLNSLKTGVDRASSIVKSLNQFSRVSKLNNEECYIHSIIENCLTMLNSQIKDDIKITKQFLTNEPIIKGNVGNLHQVFLNILTNSIQALGNEGKIDIKTELKKNEIQVIISDTGTGITEKDLSKITDPFFTTKEPGEGTGLGLSITYNIIKEHKGNINFESFPNKGTIVSVYLPIE